MLQLNGLYHLDNMIGMKDFPDKYFDLAIVDPPYGINATKMQMGSHPNRMGDGYPSISTAVKLKGRLNNGSGKLKNRLLNKSSIDWDNQIPDPEYFTELFRVSKNQVIWGGELFSPAANQVYYLLGQNAVVGELLSMGNGLDFFR